MMKKALQLLAVAALVMAAQGNAWAYDGTVVAPSGQTLYYDYVDSTGSITIVRPTSSGWGTETQPTGVLVIPDSVEHLGTMYPVTAVGNNAFEYCEGLTAVTLPQGLVAIGIRAFNGCSIVSLAIPDGVTEIGYRAFGGIRHIDYHGSATWADYDNRWGASILNGVLDGDFLYADSTLTTLTGYIGSATDVTIPATVTAIGPEAFSGFQMLSNVVFPEGLVSIGEEAFLDCYYLTSLNLPESLREIGARAFADLLNIPNVRIPDSVASIGENAFYLFRHLEYYGNATYAADNLYWGAFSLNGVHDGNFIYSDSTHTTLTCYLGNGPHVTIPSTVDTIGQGAFIACEGLTSVTIHDGVSHLSNHAFAYCINLPSITLPTGLTAIDDEVFASCHALTAIHIPDSVTSIGYAAFAYCSSLTSVNLPEGLDTIDFCAFMECRALPAITFPSSVTYIGGMAFVYCTSLMDVYALRDSTPEVVGLAFWRTPDSAVVHVPCGSLESYTSEWSSYFDSISEEMMHTLTLLPSDETMGWVEVLTEPDCQQDAVVQAVPANDYHFEGWSITPGYQNLVTDNPLTIAVTEDMTLVAHFAPDGVGIGEIEKGELIIGIIGTSLSVNNPDGEAISVYDIAGRQLATSHLSIFTYQLSNPGVYLVQVGSRPAQKVVVIKSN